MSLLAVGVDAGLAGSAGSSTKGVVDLRGGTVNALSVGDLVVSPSSGVPAAGAGTLSTHTPLFIFWLIAVVIIVGALGFLPALALGPIVEHLMIFH